MKALTIEDIEKFLLEGACKKENQPPLLIIRGHRDSVMQWMEMFDKEVREQCGKI